MIRPRKAIERLTQYRPPQEGRGGKMRLDFNENTVGCARQVVRALRRAVNPEMLTRYPEYDEGRRTLAAYFGVAPEELVLTNGTDDAIKTVCDTFVDPDDTLLVPAPTFPVYEFFHSVAGGKTLRIRYDENFRLPSKKFVSALKRQPVRWVALANPNNPTGTQIPHADLKAILLAAPETLVLVDEAYHDFAGRDRSSLDSQISQPGRDPNLLEGLRPGGAAPGLPVRQRGSSPKLCAGARILSR